MTPLEQISKASAALKQAALNYANASEAPGGNATWRNAQAQALYDAAYNYVEAKGALNDYLENPPPSRGA